MKTIVNKTAMPLRVPLPGGKVLHLGPTKSGQVADTAVEHPALRKLIEAGKIQVQGEGSDGAGGDGGGAGNNAPASSQSKGKITNVHRRGGQRGS
jgi:hypothetical protein